MYTHNTHIRQVAVGQVMLGLDRGELRRQVGRVLVLAPPLSDPVAVDQTAEVRDDVHVSFGQARAPATWVGGWVGGWVLESDQRHWRARATTTTIAT
jgi:hypothetical protein